MFGDVVVNGKGGRELSRSLTRLLAVGPRNDTKIVARVYARAYYFSIC